MAYLWLEFAVPGLIAGWLLMHTRKHFQRWLIRRRKQDGQLIFVTPWTPDAPQPSDQR